jgi:hypothetical protein
MGCSVLRPDLATVVVAALTIAACGSPPPSAVDEELLFVDLSLCAKNDPACEKSGDVGSKAVVFDGEHDVVLDAALRCGPTNEYCDPNVTECCADNPTKCVLKGSCGPGAPLVQPKPASISLPILDHPADARLAWIAIGIGSTKNERELKITVDGVESVVRPSEGWLRFELSGQNRTIAPGARLKIEATRGAYGLVWVVGRWKR